MDPSRKRWFLLGVLALVLATSVWWQATGRRGKAGDGASARSATAAATGNGRSPTVSIIEVPAIELDALQRERPMPVPVGRDPFRFQPRPRADAASMPVRPGGMAGGDPGAASVAPAPVGPPPPPPAPPIPLKFIGIVEVTGKASRMAVLSDSRGVYFGAEGEVIEGRYRIVRIGAESIEMMYLDGTGRRVIRLSGS